MSYLPPPTTRGLIRETLLLVSGCLLGILVLGTVVYFLAV